jgi:hypothetical protein
MEDADGILWTLSQVPDPKWADIKPGGVVSVAKSHGRVDVLVTAIDPRAGVVLAETRLPGPVGFVSETTLIFMKEEDNDGLVTIRIMQLRLKRN